MIPLLAVYLVFVGVGFPDSLLGTAWPFIREELSLSTDGAGLLSILISLGIISASLLCSRMAQKVGFCRWTIAGICTMILALVGYAAARSFWQLCLLSCILGFGSGTLQTLINDFVAENYTERYMNWLQGAWGIGAVLGPVILSASAGKDVSWRGGYLFVAFAEILILVVFGLTASKRESPHEKRKENSHTDFQKIQSYIQVKDKLPLVGQYFLYCSMENMMMLWGASYLIGEKNLSSTAAAGTVSCFFMGLTAGRLLCGCFPGKENGIKTIGVSAVISALLDVLLLFWGGRIILLFLFFMLGMAMAPQYPLLLKVSPGFFPEENQQMLMGLQVASAYLGILVIPPILGCLFSVYSFRFLPVVEAVCLLGVWRCVTILHRRRNKNL